MLDSIQIKNFAIIDSLQVDFDQGMTALTGETGAGKSILLDAIKLIAGDRADVDSIRQGQDKAEISVCFKLEESDPAFHWLVDNEMAADGECVLRRVLFSNGRSKAFVNGITATLNQLRTLSDFMVDIHGQHEHQSLQKPQVQGQLLDNFVGDKAIVNAVKQKFELYRQLQKRLHQAQSGSQDRLQRIDLLELYCKELNLLDLSDGEFESLQVECRRLSNAGHLIEKVSGLLELLSDNEEQNLHSKLGHCEQQLTELIESDEGLKTSLELISGAAIQVQEAITELKDYRGSIDVDGERLALLNERIATAQTLARKHHVTVDKLMELSQSLNQELESLQGAAFDIETIEADFAAACESYLKEATKLSAKRTTTAAQLSSQVSEVMQQLGMSGGRFEIQVQPQKEFNSNGLDAITYLVSANPGQQAKPLAKVASGGELSRISLAIQVIMSESSQIPTLIFDEIDSGVGGGIAEIVGQKLRLLGRQRQVFCVTHLPQVASQAHQHYRVEKTSNQQHTTTDILVLGKDQRLEEIARMLGGVTITEQTRAHASEMISSQDA